jgi:hypothetical protein
MADASLVTTLFNIVILAMLILLNVSRAERATTRNRKDNALVAL